MTQLPATPPTARRPVHTGRLLLGLVVAALGVLWLLEALDVATIDWDLVLPIGVIVVGVALLAAGVAGRGSGGLIALGIVLTVLLLASAVVEIPFGAGVGDRSYRPAVLSEERAFDLAVGQLTVDLTAASWSPGGPATPRVRAHVGVGQLVVLVPRRIPCVATHAKAGVGDVRVFGQDRSGFAADYRTDAVCSGVPQLQLDLSVGIGQIEVRRD